MKRHIAILGLLIILLGLSSCKWLFQKPSVDKIQDVKVLSISPDKTEVMVSLIVHNPNSYKIRLQELNLELMDKNRSKVGRATLTKELELPKGKSINLDFKVSLDTRPMVKMVSTINQDLHFFVGGYGKAKAMGMTKNFSFEEPYSLSVKEHIDKVMPKLSANGQDLFKLTRTYVDDLGLSKSILNADFILLNPYGFTFNLKGFPAEIYIDGKSVGKGNLKNQMSFNENIFYKDGTMLFELSNLKSIVGAVKGAVRGEIAYSVKGRILIDSMGMEMVHPYEFNGKIPVNLWDILLKSGQR